MHTKTMALVLKNANYRDYDRMLTLFSGDMGRVDVLARGCRKQNSPLLPLSSVFACGEFYLAQNVRADSRHDHDRGGGACRHAGTAE